MKEDPFKLYDILISTDIYKQIIDIIKSEDIDEIEDNIWESIESIYNYKNSVMGILDNVTDDYDNLNFDAAKIQKMIGDPENLGLLREVLDKLG
jgi:hypothetical protein